MEVNNRNTLNEYYQLIHPSISERLVSSAYHEKLTSLFKLLPISTLVNLELRLDGNEQVDANLLYTKSKNLILKEWIEKGKMMDHHNLNAWISMWNDKSTFFYNQLKNIWLMYDYSIEKDHNLLPWIIITLETTGFRADIVRSLYENSAEHFDSGLNNQHWQRFEDVLVKMPSGVNLVAIGLLNRTGKQLRFGVSSFLDVDSVTDYLESIDWKGDIKFVSDHYSSPINNAVSCDLAFTIDDNLEPILGMECYLDRASNYSHASEVLDFLIDKGWCLPDYKDALLKFIGETEVPASVFKNEKTSTYSSDKVIIEKWISHFKMVYYPDKPPSAKAYIMFANQKLE